MVSYSFIYNLRVNLKHFRAQSAVRSATYKKSLYPSCIISSTERRFVQHFRIYNSLHVNSISTLKHNSSTSKLDNCSSTCQNAIASQDYGGYNPGITIYTTSSNCSQNTNKSKLDIKHVPKVFTAPLVSTRQSPTKFYMDNTLEGVWRRIKHYCANLFLPHDFPHSVTPDYIHYVRWYFLGAVTSTATGVLSMQSLLYAIGLGAGAIPTAATVNWILKDGLGQFGGILFASLVNNRYDAEPKRWRFASSLSLDISCLLEILTPVFPTYFLPVATLANVGKNISWLSASATRAGFHQTFAIRGNLAELTAKAGSQNIAASIVGTGLGLSISYFTGPDTINVLCAFSILSAFHMYSIHRSLSGVSLTTLNSERLHQTISVYIDTGSIPIPSDIRRQEHFISTFITGYKSLYRISYVNQGATLAELSNKCAKELIQLKSFYVNDNYILNISLPKRRNYLYQVNIAIAEDATTKDVIQSQFHAVLIQKELEQKLKQSISKFLLTKDEQWNIIHKTHEVTNQMFKEYIAQLNSTMWRQDALLVEKDHCRYRWLL